MEVANEKSKTKTKYFITRRRTSVNLMEASGYAGNRA
jgi:hypothetical protein